jgi:predicted DNA-binding protein
MAYVGTPIDTTNQFQSLQGKRFSGDGSTTAFTLDIAPTSVFDIEVFVENVRQDPNSAYTLNGTTLTFAAAPASGTNSIYVIHQAKAVGTITAPVGGSIDMNGVELILDEDGDTSITADTDDQIDFKTGGTDRARIDSSGRIIKGHTGSITTGSRASAVQITGTSAADSSLSMMRFNSGGGAAELILGQSRNSSIGGNTIVQNGDNVGMVQFVADDGTDYVSSVAEIRCDIDAAPGANDTAGRLRFATTADGSNSTTERMRIDSSGDVGIGKTSESFSTKGFFFNVDPGQANFTSNQDSAIRINRIGNDGDLISLQQAGSQEGTISVSGGTVSYGGFTGTHWSRLIDNSKPTILKGTILESLDEMCDWYQAVADVAESTDAEGNIIPAHQVKKSIALDSKNVGDSITFTHNNVEYTGTIAKENDVKHSKCKISDSSESKAVYGVFQAWDNDDDTVNDMYVAQTGTFVVRLNSSVTTLNKGDLIQSNGDGTGKVQADDIIRASTVAKVLSTTKIETYSDGSYIVPCSLHC